MNSLPAEPAIAATPFNSSFSISASNDPCLYDLVILGAGAAALAAASEAAKHGGRIVWATPAGGNEPDIGEARRLARAAIHGRWPGETVAARASAWQAWRHSAGATSTDNTVIHRLRTSDVELIAGHAVFTGPETVAIHGREIRFRRAVITTESRTHLPTVAGLDSADMFAAERWADVPTIPARVLLLGAGEVACEIAQALACLGCEVQLVTTTPTLLPRHHPMADDRLREQFLREGIRLHLGWTCDSVEAMHAAKLVLLRQGLERHKLFVDQIVVAGERKPRLQPLALTAARVEHGAEGIAVDEQMQTSNKRVFAAVPAATSVADAGEAAALGRLAARNALGLAREQFEATLLPRVVRTDPEIADLGMSLADARQHGHDIDVLRIGEAEQVDGAASWSSQATIWINRGSERILGATIVGREAHALADQLSLLMAQKSTLSELAEMARSGRLASASLRQLTAAFAASQGTGDDTLSPNWLGWPKSA